MEKIQDFVLRLKATYYLFAYYVQDCKKNIWQIDLDAHYCCNGDMCCCKGATNRENLSNISIHQGKS